jgi:pilus assembly protein CpaC
MFWKQSRAIAVAGGVAILAIAVPVGAAPSAPAKPAVVVREADGPLPVVKAPAAAKATTKRAVVPQTAKREAVKPATKGAAAPVAMKRAPAKSYAAKGQEAAGRAPTAPKPAASVVAGVTRAAVKTAESTLPSRPAVAAGGGPAGSGPGGGPPHSARPAARPAKAEPWLAMTGAPASGTMPRVLRTLRINESQVIDFASIQRAAVGNPNVADIAILSGNQILLNGKSPGETSLFIWDRRGQTRYDVTVVPGAADVAAVADRVRRDVGNPDVAVKAIGETLFLEGKVASEPESMRAEAIATAYTRNVKNLIVVQTAAQEALPPARTSNQVIEEMQRALTGIGVTLRPLNERTLIMEGSVTAAAAERIRRVSGALADGVQILDLLAVGQAPRRQVLVRTRVVDINKQKIRNLGVDWGRVRFQQDATGTTTAQVVDQPFLIGQTDLSPTGILEGGPLRKLDPIGARIQALVTENAARVLSEPNMFVLEGQRGNILIGGEIPIPVSQASGIGTAISVDWKQFGIQLDVEPMQIEGDTVTLRVAPEVSALDFANAVTASGITIPALRSRRAQSVVNVRSGQTIALGGLLQNDIANVVRRIPLLSKIPIIGELFKSRTFIRGESELVILVTPEIIEPGQAPHVPVPDVDLKRPSVGTKELGKESR